MNIPWIESPFFETELKEKNLSEKDIHMCRHFNKYGFAIIEGLLNSDESDKIISDIKEFYPENISLEVNRNQDLWQKKESVYELATNKRVLDALKMLYGREPFPFQTLNFKYGSQQRIHSDSIHFNSIPERFMCGVWVALEDTDENNGPLIYYPESHKEKQFNYFDINIPIDSPGYGDGLKKGTGYENYEKYEDFIEKLIEEKSWIKTELHLKKGDALIWSSNLLHGGKQVLVESRTRWSQVTHYYFKDCIYFTPMWSNFETGEFFLREPVNLITKKEVQNSVNGKELTTLFAGQGKYFGTKKIDPSLLKNTSWKQISIFIKDRIKSTFKS